MSDVKLSPLEQLDLDIIDAWSNYRLRLATFEHYPTGRHKKDAAEALAIVDELLELRYATNADI